MNHNQPSDESSLSRFFKQGLKFTFELLKTAAIMAIIAFAIKAYLIQTFVIDGLSMEPNFHHQEYLLVDKISYRFGAPERGEVVVFKPTQTADSYIKRVIGLPGETIKISGGQIYVDNRLLNEPYLVPDAKTQVSNGSLQSKTYTLREDEYFLLGDNRNNSKDSRSLGAIDFSQIQGRVFIIFYPFRALRMV